MREDIFVLILISAENLKLAEVFLVLPSSSPHWVKAS
jgi:hypothetical protein